MRKSVPSTAVCTRRFRLHRTKGWQERVELDQGLSLYRRDNAEFVLKDPKNISRESAEGMDRIPSIVDALRTFSRADDASPVPDDINDAIHNAIRIVGSELRSRCEINTNLSTCKPIPGFPGRINQLVLNLIVNEADALKGIGTINLATGDGEQGVVMTVSDNEAGLAEEDLPHLFNPFFTTKPVSRGAGLGLAIASDIVKAHNGEVTVNSELGERTNFSVSLPGNTLFSLAEETNSQVDGGGR